MSVGCRFCNRSYGQSKDRGVASTCDRRCANRGEKRSKKVTVQGGEDFGEVAMQYSEEPSAKHNKGMLGWIQPFRYVYSFEDAVYSAPVGGVTEIFRSPYGFHIAKVEEEGVFEEVKAAHIMKMTPMGDIQRMTNAQMAMDSIYNLAIQDSHRQE
mgnify:CR=1 FL=1